MGESNCKQSHQQTFTSKIYMQLSIRKTTTQSKSRPKIQTNIPLKKTYRWPTSMKRCSTLLIIREMQIQTTVRLPTLHHLVRVAIIKKIHKLQTLEKMWRKGNPLALSVGMSTDTTTTENSMEIPLKTRSKNYHMTQQSHYWAYTLRKP